MILTTLLFSIFLSVVLVNIKNNSNISSFIIIPLLVALLTKYVLGDWDIGFHWTTLDIPYWLSIIASSYGVVYTTEYLNSL